MQRFSEIVIKYNKIIIVVSILLTLFFGYCIKDLEINSDIISYFPKSDPVVKLFNHIGEEYGGNSLAIVAIETEDIFNSKTIKNINDLTQNFKNLDGVNYVTSLTSVLDIKKVVDGLEISKLIDEYNLPKREEEYKKLKNYTLSKDMYRGFLVSEDSKATLIVCRLMEGVNKVKIAEQLKDIVEKKNLKEKVYYGGIPFQMMDITAIILKDIKLLVPLVIFLIAISLFVSFRSLRGTLLPLTAVSMSTIWTLGLMSLLKIPLTALSDGIPVILIAIGSAYSIHVINKFNEISTDGNRIENSKKALSEIGIPVILAALTTSAGFIAFIFGSYLNMIRDFGIFASLGVLFALITSITFVPSVLSLLPSKVRKSDGDNSPLQKSVTDLFMDRVGEWVLRNEKPIIVVVIVIIIISIFGMPHIDRKVDMLDYFKKGSSIRMTEEMMEEKFGGSVPIQILVRGDIQNPAVLKEMKKFEDFLESLGNVYNAQSVADLIEEMSDVLDEGKNIPDSRDKVANLWFLLEGEEIMSQLVNPDKNEAVIQATITDVNTERIKELVRNVDNYIKKIDASNGAFTQTGIPSIYQHLDDSIMSSQLQSLIIAIILVFICLLFLLRSFIGGIIGLAPIGFTLLVIFGFMGYSGIPLDIATVLIGSVSIGIGIDYSIHFISRFKKEFNREASALEALDKTLETTGKAIVINVITVTSGFLVFVLADLVPTQRFGVLISLTMISAGVGAITLLPSILLLTKAGFVGDWNRFSGKFANNIKDRISAVSKKRLK